MSIELKLGRLPKKIDYRTIQLQNIIRPELLPPLPPSFDVDVDVGGIQSTNPYNNTKYGDCVIAGQANHILRFEKSEQKVEIPITEQEVVNEYFKQSGGADSGLYMLDSLNHWRTGWLAAGKTYNIYAFAQLRPSDYSTIDEYLGALKYCIYLLRGIYVGANMPLSAQRQYKNGEIWSIGDRPEYNPGSWGGHCLYIKQFDEAGLTCMTWGKKQRMTWGWYYTYVDETYAVVDNKDEWMGDASPVDVNLLQGYLNEIHNQSPPPEPIPSTCGRGRTVAKITQALSNIIPIVLRRQGRFYVHYLNPQKKKESRR